MKTKVIFLTLILLVSNACASPQRIAIGNQPGEIYLVGLHPELAYLVGFYYSSNFGQDIELRGRSYLEDFGGLLPDAGDETLYRFFYGPFHLQSVSFNGGFDWDATNITNATGSSSAASGIISGEVYRHKEQPQDYQLERSTYFGQYYLTCSSLGFPDTSRIEDVVLGSTPGEVYLWDAFGNLYYSSDYGENFTFQGNLQQSAGIYTTSEFANGAEPGEIYALHHDNKSIWRISDYGNNVELIADFPHSTQWSGGLSSSGSPGELYFLLIDPDMVPGGTMEIYHTTNYGQDWTLFEHYIPWNGIISGQSNLPSNMHLQVWPNPANDFFTIAYKIKTSGDVELGIYNLVGQQIWKYLPGIQLPGSYQLILDHKQIPSGTYILQLQAEGKNTAKTITILK